MTYSSELGELKAENLRLRKLIKCCGPNTRCKTGAAFLKKEAPVPSNQIRVLFELGSKVSPDGVMPPELNNSKIYSFLLENPSLVFDHKLFIKDIVGVYSKSTVSLTGEIKHEPSLCNR